MTDVYKRQMFVHILPNTVPVLLSAIMIGFNNAVLAEAGMSYLGIGVQPPQSSLGRMLSEAQTYLFSAPGFALFPGIFLIMLVLGFSLLGEGLKDREKEMCIRDRVTSSTRCMYRILQSCISLTNRRSKNS